MYHVQWIIQRKMLVRTQYRSCQAGRYFGAEFEMSTTYQHG